jgi:hypothetical protein
VLPVVVAIAIGLFAGMLACLEVGHRVGRAAALRDQHFHDGVGPIEAAIFAILGLLLGFAFAGAMSRLDTRRELIVHEANAIGTAYLRLDLVPAADQPSLRALFRDYLDARLRAYEAGDMGAADAATQRGTELQQRLWAAVVASARGDASQNVARVVVPAINEMIDVTTARTVARAARLPTPILVLLLSVALLSALIAGYGMAVRPSRRWLHWLLYAGVASITVYVVADLDNPRIGLITLDATEAVLRDLRQSIR